MIDTHAHIYATDFDDDRDAMLQRAFAAGVTRVCMPNVDGQSIEAMLHLEASHPERCYAMMGLHPCSVTAQFADDLQLVETWLNQRPFIAVGEIGLDFYWSTEFQAQQTEAFRIQVQLAQKHQLPVVIHCRNSFRETVDVLKEMAVPGLRGIFHCFTGNLADAYEAIEFGFVLGIGGVSTFKNGGLDKVLPLIDARHLVLETDSPYLAPVPYRGKRNEPSYLSLIAQRVADLKQMPVSEIIRITTENALRCMPGLSGQHR